MTNTLECSTYSILGSNDWDMGWYARPSSDVKVAHV